MRKQTKNESKRFLNGFGSAFAAPILSVLPVSMLVGASSADKVPVLARTAILRAHGGVLAIFSIFSVRQHSD